MKVGRVKVEHIGQVVRTTITTGRGYEVLFERNACNNYHAELEEHDIYQGLRNMRIELQREIVERLRRSKLPGIRRGKLAEEIERIERMYGL